MKIRYERPVCHAAFWSYRLGLFALALFAISAGLHRFGIMETENFAVLFAICTGVALLAFVLACYGILRLWMVGAEGGRASAKGSIFALFVLVPASIAAYRAYSLPPLYDISTNTADVPVFLEPIGHGPEWMPQIEILSAAPYEGQSEAYPQVTGRRYEGALDRVLAAVRLVAENRGIEISETRMPEPVDPEKPDPGPSILQISPSAQEEFGLASILPDEAEAVSVEPMILKQAQVLLQGEARTPIFGFSSDVSIRLSEEAETTFVDMRSVSRFGPHDLGTNARIINGFLRALDTELVGISVR